MTTDATGTGTFGTLLPVAVSPHMALTETVTGQSGNTTAFSAAVAVSPQPVDKMTFSASPLSSTLGSPVTFSATVSSPVSAIGLPTGDVIFKDGLTVLATVKVDGTGKASYSTTSLTRGAHTLYAIYNGDPVFFGVKADPVNVAVS